MREREEMSNLQVREEVEQGRSGRSKRKVDEDEAKAKVWAGRCEISEMARGIESSSLGSFTKGKVGMMVIMV